MEELIKNELKTKLDDAESVLALCMADRAYNHSLLIHIKPLSEQVKIIDHIFDLLTPSYVEQFHLSYQVQRCQCLGYIIYRTLMGITSALGGGLPGNP